MEGRWVGSKTARGIWADGDGGSPGRPSGFSKVSDLPMWTFWSWMLSNLLDVGLFAVAAVVLAMGLLGLR